MSQAIHALIFDIDGTLLDSSAQDEELYKQAVEQVLGSVQFRSSLHEYDNVTDTGILLQTLADNGVEPEPVIIDAIKSAFCTLVDQFVRMQGPFREMPGARELLQRIIHSSSHGLAIATGGWRCSAEIKLATAGFNPGALTLATSDDAITRTDIMKMALQSLDVRASMVTYYGDAVWDRQACEQLGWRFVAVGPVLNGLSSFDQELVD
jgi:beta-phosphoglucomutase-like phosphatase (HAD superfamily)